jgi:hypothetical protein
MDRNNLLMDRNNLFFAYGNIIKSLNIIVISGRHISTISSTQYNMETTIIIDITNHNQKIIDLFACNCMNLFTYNSISHNFSILKIDDIYIGIGGVSMPGYCTFPKGAPANYANIGKYKDGLYLMKSYNCKTWSEPIKIIDRDWGLHNECCAFDSQPSLLFNIINNNYYLYCRWNPLQNHRKLQVFITNNIDIWYNNAIEVTVDVDIYIYYAYVFKYQDTFIAIVRYYNNIKTVNNYDTHNNGILLSSNGINFTMFKPSIIGSEYTILQGHIIQNNEIIVYYLTNNGTVKEYNFNVSALIGELK